MSCPNTAFQPDFFNNAAAIAVVLLFTKVVTHRLRKVRRMRWVDWLHGLAVMGSVVASARRLTWLIVLPGSVSVSPASRCFSTSVSKT